MFAELNDEAIIAPSCCTPSLHTAKEIEEIVVYARLELYNRNVPCGPRALRKHLDEALHIQPLPSERSIARILAHNGLTHGRTGWYAGECPECGSSQCPANEQNDERR
jgi:hypothetical protein